ncbi:MAG: ABC transporter ATP-binding protein [Lachnospiraceae bacterium]|nr:ABC transporter ATP-binding protein [Lachnospiraceae bacterium]
MAALTLQHVTKTYSNHTEAVRDVSLTVDDGEFVLLTGDTGYGKSTLLKLIAGLQSVTFGKILLDGKEIQDLAADERDISIMTQELDLFPHLTILQNLEEAARHGAEAPEDLSARIEAIAERLQITEDLTKKPKQLPPHRKWRAAFAKAWMENRSVLLLDEPLADAPASEKQDACETIRRLCRERKVTALCVTHDPAEMEFFAGRRIRLGEGRL